MSDKHFLLRKILITTVGLLFLGIIVYSGINLITIKGGSSRNINKSNVQESILTDEIKNQAIEITKNFALSFFDGTAFTDDTVQPVSDEYKKFLRIEQEEYEKSGKSPLGGSVLKFGDVLVIPEPTFGSNAFAVWIITTIRTRSGIEKRVVFITRVAFMNNEYLIDTAGVIPYKEMH